MAGLKTEKGLGLGSAATNEACGAQEESGGGFDRGGVQWWRAGTPTARRQGLGTRLTSLASAAPAAAAAPTRTWQARSAKAAQARSVEQRILLGGGR